MVCSFLKHINKYIYQFIYSYESIQVTIFEDESKWQEK